MESWLPLFDIFLNSPTDASGWLKESSFSSSSSTPINTAAFLSLLSTPYDATVLSPPLPCFPAPPQTKRVMLIQTLPPMVQSRILSFLALEHERFTARDLSSLACGILSGGKEIDFWVESAARNLLEIIPEPSYERVSLLSVDYGDEGLRKKFESVPSWLRKAASANAKLLPWLPLSQDELNKAQSYAVCDEDGGLSSQFGETEMDNINGEVEEIGLCNPLNAPLDSEIRDMAISLRDQIANFESTGRTVALANKIRELCLEKGLDAAAVLELVEPWNADDEAASVLISHLADGSENELAWPSLVICSVILPRLLVLEVPVARVLLTATVEYCKLHQKATEYALLLPLLLRKEGINNPLCELITRIIKECLHPAHVAAFCHKLLMNRKDDNRLICLPSHECLISSELVWTESLFNLFQNILNHNVHLTQDTIDEIVTWVHKLCTRFSKSLKFGNFLLCFVTKCGSSLKSHRKSLTEAVECTSTFVTKSILSKLSNL